MSSILFAAGSTLRLFLIIMAVLTVLVVGTISVIIVSSEIKDGHAQQASICSKNGLDSFRHGNYDAAQRFLEKAVAEAEMTGVSSSVLQPLSDLGDCYIQEKDFSQAEACLKKSLNLYQQELADCHDPNERFAIERQKLTNQVQLASVLQQEDKPEEALPLYQEALKGDDNVLGGAEGKLKISLEYAKLLRQLGREEEANKLEISSESESTTEQGSAPEVPMYEAMSLAATGKLPQALTKFAIATRIAREQKRAELIEGSVYCTGVCHLGLHQYAEAEHSFRQALAGAPDNRDTFNGTVLTELALSLHLQGKDSEGQAVLKSPLAELPPDAFVPNLFGLLFQRSKFKEVDSLCAWLQNAQSGNFGLLGDALYWQAVSQDYQSQRAQSVNSLEHALAAYRKTKDKCPLKAARALIRLAKFDEEQSPPHWRAAQDAWEQALEFAKGCAGNPEPTTRRLASLLLTDSFVGLCANFDSQRKYDLDESRYRRDFLPFTNQFFKRKEGAAYEIQWKLLSIGHEHDRAIWQCWVNCLICLDYSHDGNPERSKVAFERAVSALKDVPREQASSWAAFARKVWIPKLQRNGKKDDASTIARILTEAGMP